MAETTIIYPETSPLALDFYTTGVSGLVIAPVNVVAYVDASGYSTPVSAAAPLPVSISGSGGGDVEVVGNVANGDADTGNPVKVGGKAFAPDTPQTAVDAGDRVNLMSDLNGRPITYLGTCLDAVNDSITNLEKWRVMTAVFSFFDDGGVNPTLKALASGSTILSAEYDNSANLYQWLELKMSCRGTTFTATTFDIWILPSLDGTTYPDASNGAPGTVPANVPDAYFYVRAVSTQQVLSPLRLQVPPSKFKIFVRNTAGAACTNVNSENGMTGYFH